MVGITEMRKSQVTPSVFSEKLPSWGSLVSPTFIPPSTFTRTEKPCAMDNGHFPNAESLPSLRKRT